MAFLRFAVPEYDFRAFKDLSWTEPTFLSAHEVDARIKGQADGEAGFAGGDASMTALRLWKGCGVPVYKCKNYAGRCAVTCSNYHRTCLPTHAECSRIDAVTTQRERAAS